MRLACKLDKAVHKLQQTYVLNYWQTGVTLCLREHNFMVLKKIILFTYVTIVVLDCFLFP